MKPLKFLSQHKGTGNHFKTHWIHINMHNDITLKQKETNSKALNSPILKENNKTPKVKSVPPKRAKGKFNFKKT